MGSRTWAVGVIWGIAVAGPAFAQSPFSALLHGSSPAPQVTVIGKPIDTSNVVAPYPKPSNPSAMSRFFHSLNPVNLFSKRSATSAAPKLGAGPLPATGSVPTAKRSSGLPQMLPIAGH